MMQSCDGMEMGMEPLSRGFFEKAHALNQYLTIPVWKEPLLKRAYEMFGNPVILCDYSHKIIGEYCEGVIEYHRWNKLLETRDFPSDWIDRVFHNNVAELIQRSNVIYSLDYEVPIHVGSIIRNDVCYGFLCVLEERRKLDFEDQKLIKEICDIIAIRLAEAQENPLYGSSFYGPLLRDILSGDVSGKEDLKKRMRTRNWALRTHYRVVNIEIPFDNEYAPPKQYVLRRLSEISKQLITVEYNGKILVLIEGSSLSYLEMVFERLFAQINALNLRAGVSEVFHDLLDLPRYYFQSVKVLVLGKNTKKNIVLYDEYKLSDFLTELTQNLSYKHFYHNSVLLLEEYDTENGTTFSNTLYHYLISGKSITKSSRSLFIHKNTVAGHIDKIKKITGNKLTDSDDTFHMLLTYKIMRFVEVL
jgi:hypothetical protein